ncbi:MAG TPA: hypothetical protein VN132_03635, partial [Bdellovibrio sp.]|nr:hypothetical protein [Bdellovibrio sp.]
MSKLKIALTTGDHDGIGFEVTTKALHKIGPQKNIQFILWRSQGASKKYLNLIDKKFSRKAVPTLREALRIENDSLIEIISDLSPAEWVEQTAKACYSKKMSAMATAPLSKTSIKEA